MASVNIYDRETKECKEVANKTKAAILDSVMSDESTNAVQNKVIKEYTDNSVERLNEVVFDTIEKTHKLGVVENELFTGNDLNNCLEVGIYKIPYAGLANEIVNIPEKMAGKLIVEDSVGSTDDINTAEYAYFTQTYMTLTGNSYTRTIFKEGTASLRFGEWKLNTAGLANESISDEWDSHITYGVGAYVIYNNSLWKCLVQNAGQTPVEGTHWTKVSIAGEISKLNSDLSQLVNPNLLINPDFKINQRSGKIALQGTTFYDNEDCTTALGTIDNTHKVERLANGNYIFLNAYGDSIYIKASDVVDGYCGLGYTVDRWITDENITLIKKNKGVHLSYSQRGAIHQTLEEELEGTFTLSAKFSDNNGAGEFEIQAFNSDGWLPVNGGHVTTRETSGILKTTFTGKILGVALRAASANIEWVKLELGSVATPFVPPDPASELLKCQRYFVRLFANEVTTHYFGVGSFVDGDTSVAYILINLPVQMRIEPTFFSSPLNTFLLFYHGMTANPGRTVTTITLQNNSRMTPRLRVVETGGNAVGGIVAMLRTNENCGDAYLDFDAELH